MEKGESPTILLPNSAEDEIQELVQKLEQEISWDGDRLYRYGGFWIQDTLLPPLIRFQKYFIAHDTDILLCTNPKCGTTWLKALVFSIANRHTYSVDRSPLLTANPHHLVPFLDIDIYTEHENPDLAYIQSPRILATHVPYQLLPNSVRDSKSCRIIHICRNPLDQFISLVHFLLGLTKKNIEKSTRELPAFPIDEAFDEFCKGIYRYGPFWDHIRGYWDAHQENPQKVLFLKYEDLKEDIFSNIKKIAEFIGFPFSIEEEKQGLIEQIATLCSFEKLKNLEVNKMGKSKNVIKHSSLFRKGEVGDWINYLTPEMAQRLEKILQSKFEGSSALKFNFSHKEV